MFVTCVHSSSNRRIYNVMRLDYDDSDDDDDDDDDSDKYDSISYRSVTSSGTCRNDGYCQ